MDLSPKGVIRTLGHVGAAAQNALEVARFGGLETDEEPSPYEVVSEQRVYRLRHYFPDLAGPDDARPPVILVPPLMMTAEVWDVSTSTSAVLQLADQGIDPWVVDFGSPEHEAGGLERTLTDHVLAVSDAVDQVAKARGRGAHLGGYSQGGMFCYLAAAYRRNDAIDSLITFGSPVDITKMIPLGLPVDATTQAVGALADTVLPRLTIPGWLTRAGFRLLDPVKAVRSRVEFIGQLYDRDALLPRERQRRFLDTEGWVAFPGPALAELMRQFVATNRMLQGGFVIEGTMATLADISRPILCFVGDVDQIAPPAAVRGITRASPRAEVYESTLHTGHFGLVVGSTATRGSWPVVAAWVNWRDGRGEPPEGVASMTDSDAAPTPGTSAAVGRTLAMAVEIPVNVARFGARSASRATRRARHMTADAFEQLARLNRLGAVQPSSRMSLGHLLDEQARSAGDQTFFLFEDRGYNYRAAKTRIDNVVHGLISVGVRQGEHVGLMMGVRPTALASVAALNRIGAVAVLMRPDGSPGREAELGQITRMLSDPEHADTAAGAGVGPVLVLGGGGEPRHLGDGIIDMERIDPDQVAVPSWYSPNPGRARDLAFMVFTGEGEGTRVKRITNRRWAVSAFGTASAASLARSDTVYSVAPIYHPAGLLTSAGGAVAGGARLALAAGFDPETFWDEVRRYGVTVVSYTWTQLRPLVDGPDHPGEHYHPIRLFIGSGMPAGLWRRTVARFAPARVLEFYASTEGEAVLVNLSGVKVGAKGRPLPGSAEVRVAEYDVESSQLVIGPDGFAVPCATGDVGMLLSRAQEDRGGLFGTPLRGVFSRGDVWHETSDLFFRDADGDHWMVDHVSGVIRTRSGAVFSLPIEDALGRLDAVDLAVAFGVADGDGYEIPVAAVTVRDGYSLDGDDVTAALLAFDADHLPRVVRVVDEIPVTTWYRPIKSRLRREGLGDPASQPTWKWDAGEGGYVRA